MPWRAPGTAPVRGSGCGVAGGSPFTNMTSNGGDPPPGFAQGADGLTLPATTPTVWRRGDVVEVAHGLMANHGGGYSWRLCPNDGKAPVTEECFQKNTLRFAGAEQTLVYGETMQWGKVRQLPNLTLPLVLVTEGTFPAGSEWARNPIPSCLLCDQGECTRKGLPWKEEQYCSQACSGFNMTQCPPGMTQFPEPAPGLSGYYTYSTCNGLTGFNFNIVDKVQGALMPTLRSITEHVFFPSPYSRRHPAPSSFVADVAVEQDGSPDPCLLWHLFGRCLQLRCPGVCYC